MSYVKVIDEDIYALKEGKVILTKSLPIMSSAIVAYLSLPTKRRPQEIVLITILETVEIS